MVAEIFLIFILGVCVLVQASIHKAHRREVDRINNEWANRMERQVDRANREREDLINRLVAMTDLEAAASTMGATSQEGLEVKYVGTEHEGRGGYLHGQED